MPDTEVSQSEKCRVIAEKVMGWKWAQSPDTWEGPHMCWLGEYEGRACEICTDFDPFTDPAAMVEVMEKLQNFDIPTLGIVLQSWPDEWVAGVHALDKHEVVGSGPTPMHAVAEAAYQYALTIQ